jgi:hypothetical protein
MTERLGGDMPRSLRRRRGRALLPGGGAGDGRRETVKLASAGW